MRHDELIKAKAEELQRIWDNSTHNNADELMEEFAKRMLQFGAECYEKGYYEGKGKPQGDVLGVLINDFENEKEEFISQQEFIDRKKASLGLIEGK